MVIKKAILFDLDGTLLRIDTNTFIKHYTKMLVGSFEGHADTEQVYRAFIEGTRAMLKEHPGVTNAEAFHSVFDPIVGLPGQKLKSIIDSFYEKEFPKLEALLEDDKSFGDVIDHLKDKGYTLVLATNPLFPEVATLERLRWTGLNKDLFSIITTYEESKFTKPSKDYYFDILERLNIKPEEALMVGNSIKDDLVAQNYGIETFIIEDYLTDFEEYDLCKGMRGDLESFKEYIISNF